MLNNEEVMTLYHRILERIDDKRLDIITLDVFDTIVFRHVNYPTALFEKVVSEVPALNGFSGEDYRVLREQAERAAREQASHKEDIVFEEIFQCMPFDTVTKQTLLDAELLAEKNHAMVNESMVAVIDTLLAKGVSVALISDMYLSEQQIKDTFFFNWPTLYKLPLFVSSEFGKTKHSGSLFRLLAKTQAWSFSRWLHIGDNEKADVSSPHAMGIQTLYFHPALDTQRITAIESQHFLADTHSSATRLLASLQQDGNTQVEQVAFEIGAFVWGPVFDAFTDWIIKQSDASGCKHILCLMREGYLFTPLVKRKLELQGRKDIKVSAFYVSRKSAFWPGIDTSQPQWLENVMDTLMLYRGYTLKNFIRDFHLSDELLSLLNGDLELKNIENLFVEGEALYARLVREAKVHTTQLEHKIETQRRLLKTYLKQVTSAKYSECAVIDFGNGGTIQHNLEVILGESAGANLLFYASIRAYRFVEKTLCRAFISPGTERFHVSKKLARSPECIEALLLGDKGSTLSYKQNNGNVEPVLAKGITANKELCEKFLSGCLSFAENAFKHGKPALEAATVQAIVARYILMPTDLEASLFTQLYHQDNFGTDGEYTVIDEGQKQLINQYGLEKSLFKLTGDKDWELGNVHWPSGVIALIDNDFIPRSLGLLDADNHYHVQILIKKLLNLKWHTVSVYGAGEFFRDILPLLKSNGITVERVIDRRAQSDESISVAGYRVTTIEDALYQGSRHILITSYAFREEIANRIMHAAAEQKLDNVQMISV
ncbi:hypothetical protein [Alteromonas sp. C1M14]|uniref:HAD family hydrolase n=1 Tax=Alteromonas sp. C1M14 TaxID=2841567 RepID=UPI001C0A1542|nr:hypothetical protein [Alteromonas sp. C1M14]MBU2977953.1 hypothetical protein [Alteromonas sp. C1M14]